MLLILVALGGLIFATNHVTRPLAPGQRVVAWVVVVLAIAWLSMTLVHMGVLGRVAEP